MVRYGTFNMMSCRVNSVALGWSKMNVLQTRAHGLISCMQAAHQRFKEAVPMRIRNHLLRHVVEQYGMEEAITGRLVRRAGEGEAAGAAAAGTGWGQGPEEERERVAVAAAVAAAGVRPEGQAAARGASLFEQRLAGGCTKRGWHGCINAQLTTYVRQGCVPLVAASAVTG